MFVKRDRKDKVALPSKREGLSDYFLCKIPQPLRICLGSNKHGWNMQLTFGRDEPERRTRAQRARSQRHNRRGRRQVFLYGVG